MRRPVVDLFAGPGGLGEGFSGLSIAGASPYRIAISIEKDESAHRTLRFRAFQRRLREEGISIDPATIDPRSPAPHEPVLENLPPECAEIWEEVKPEAQLIEMGPDTRAKVFDLLQPIGRDSVVIGGPPCQAYSLVGRSRNRGVEGYRAADDHRHFLYEEYVRILGKVEPACFVMENVKGLLSAKVREKGIFGQIQKDLETAGEGGGEKKTYRLIPLAPDGEPDQGVLFTDPRPRDFVIRAEEFGVPQARHRVIMLGVREDVARDFERRTGESLRAWARRGFAASVAPAEAGDVLDGLPALRSRMSRRGKDGGAWTTHVTEQIRKIRASSDLGAKLGEHHDEFVARLTEIGSRITETEAEGGGCSRVTSRVPEDLRSWLAGEFRGALFNHEPRGHMADDLGRYLFTSLFGEIVGRSPKAPDFPEDLAPDHKSWGKGKFSDRFRVQLAGAPSTTVTSHISKDGHYFIHPDPVQCRSLTVREAARLQTFPDDYVFFGNRTQQYVQVGNAVPPFLAKRIARVVHELLAGAGR